MKKNQYVNTFNIEFNGNQYVINITNPKRSDSMRNSITYDCMTYTQDMVPFKRFTLVYNNKDREFWAWTANIIFENIRIFVESVCEYVNENKGLILSA